MPTEHYIKWRSKDINKARRLIKNFNSKIQRNIQKGINPEFLPKKISLKEFKTNTETRRQFNNTISAMERFLKRGSEQLITTAKGNVLTRWARKEISIMLSAINNRRANRRKEIINTDAKSRGQLLGLKRGEMGDERLQDFLPKAFNIDKPRQGEEWKRAINAIETEFRFNIKDSLYKENYLKALRFGLSQIGYDSQREQMLLIIDKVEKMSAYDVVKIYYTDESASIDFAYASDFDMIDAKLNELAAVWNVDIDIG